MNRLITRSRGLYGALTAIATALLLSTPSIAITIDNFPAVQKVAATGGAVTHMNQLPKEHVTLSLFANGKGATCLTGLTGSDLNFFRISPNGGFSSFEVPNGKVLVVTDFNTTAFIPERFDESASIQTILRLGKKGASGGEIVFRSHLHLTSDLASRNFTTGDKLPSGILVGSAGALCPQMTLDDGSLSGLPLIVTSGNYRGYLIDDGSRIRRITSINRGSTATNITGKKP